MANYQNPVIKGYSADPSICRSGQDFYLVTSTGEFCPGVPVYHSTNLVHWRLAGHCLERETQLLLEDCAPSAGIYAPTIRCHNGTFYMVTTNTSNGGNFIVHAQKAAGPWSDPVWIETEGIDPSLFFEEDGRCIYCSTHTDDAGRQCVVAFELDPVTGRALGETHIISYGNGGKFPEGPHIYKIQGWYYLILAEGGTEYGHMVTIFRSRTLYGPYESCPRNPVLTHRDYQGSPIQAVGHGDLFEDGNGNWWLVCHGIRQLDFRMLHNLGRETFLVPVVWGADGWPVLGNEGRIGQAMSGPLPGYRATQTVPPSTTCFFDDFVDPCWPKEWTFVRSNERKQYARGGGVLRIQGSDMGLSGCAPSFVGIRQPEHVTTASVLVSTNLQEGQWVGLAAYYNQYSHYQACLLRENGTLYAALHKHIMDVEQLVGKQALDFDDEWVELCFQADAIQYSFTCNTANKAIPLGTAQTAGLCTEGQMVMCFTGTFVGLFSEGGAGCFKSFALEGEAAAQ